MISLSETESLRQLSKTVGLCKLTEWIFIVGVLLCGNALTLGSFSHQGGMSFALSFNWLQQYL